MAYTNIEKVTNQQAANARGGVAFANQQPGHAGESWACAPGFDGETVDKVPVPQTNDYQKGLWIYTIKGCCQVIDDDWTITGKWTETDTALLIARGEGAGGNIQVIIAADGNITMSKAQ